jgi:hypothetical protein
MKLSNFSNPPPLIYFEIFIRKEPEMMNAHCQHTLEENENCATQIWKIKIKKKKRGGRRDSPTAIK